jgi:predicted ATPase
MLRNPELPIKAPLSEGWMPALRRLRVQNFRSLKDVEVDLGPINVLVGPNGAGKSNLLDVIAFLRDAVRTDLRPALDDRGGFFRVRYRGEGSGAVQISLVANVTSYASANAPDEYSMRLVGRRLRDRRHGYVIQRKETFQFKRTSGAGRRLTIKGSDVQIADGEAQISHRLLQKDSLALATLPRLTDEGGGRQVQQIAELFRDFRVFDVNVDRTREFPESTGTPPLREDGSNLASFLSYLESRHPDSFRRLTTDAKLLIPGFSGIEFARVATGDDQVVIMLLNEAGLDGPTLAPEASYGTMRALALLALLYDPDPPKLTCIEEFDHGLHPYAFDLLVERLREASQKTQFLIATHSPALVNRLRPDEIIVCERDPATGASRIPAISSKRVRAMEQAAGGQLGLGELWFSGALGGVPEA